MDAFAASGSSSFQGVWASKPARYFPKKVPLALGLSLIDCSEKNGLGQDYSYLVFYTHTAGGAFISEHEHSGGKPCVKIVKGICLGIQEKQCNIELIAIDFCPLAALIRGNRTNCTQFSRKLDWLVSKLERLESSSGKYHHTSNQTHTLALIIEGLYINQSVLRSHKLTVPPSASAHISMVLALALSLQYYMGFITSCEQFSV